MYLFLHRNIRSRWWLNYILLWKQPFPCKTSCWSAEPGWWFATDTINCRGKSIQRQRENEQGLWLYRTVHFVSSQKTIWIWCHKRPCIWHDAQYSYECSIKPSSPFHFRGNHYSRCWWYAENIPMDSRCVHVKRRFNSLTFAGNNTDLNFRLLVNNH